MPFVALDALTAAQPSEPAEPAEPAERGRPWRWEGWDIGEQRLGKSNKHGFYFYMGLRSWNSFKMLLNSI